MDISTMDAMYIWLIAGVALLMLEALGIPGAGLLFAALGALITGTLLYLNLISETAYLAQFISFFLTTGVCALILWKPMKRFRTGMKEKKYHNIIGDTAIAGKNGITKEGGRVKWSGTTMRAQLAEDADGENIASGAQVTITDIEGTTLFVKRK